MLVTYIETCLCGIKYYVSQQVDKQIQSDQLSIITRSHGPWLLFLEKDKRFSLSRTSDYKGQCFIEYSEVIRSLRAKEILRAINCFKNRIDAENGAHLNI